MVALKDAIAALEPKAAANPVAMLGLARLMLKDGQSARALALCRAAQALAPQDARLAAEVRALLNSTIPDWHFKIIRDEARNAAYDAALRRAVRPGCRVLDIGTGSGLFAMMAARAGAAEVIACEMNPVIAEQASEIVRRNGYADRVRVIAKHSGQLGAKADLGSRVDVIVSEIVSNDLLSQDVLAIHEHAVRHLLKPGGRVIPARGAIRVALAEWHGKNSDLVDVAGFDLIDFHALAPAQRLPVGDRQLALRSEAADLFIFDFASTEFHPPALGSATCRATGGRANGIAQWIRLELDDATCHENRPGDETKSCWAVRFTPLRDFIETHARQEIAIFGSHDRSSLVLWL
jgi:protein arginine N-methyltransferase 7